MNYPEDFMNKIINGDCLQVMKHIPDNSIDFILTDPPYGIDFLSPITDNHTKIKNDSFDDFKLLLPDMLSEFKRILKDTAVCCCCCGGGKTPVSQIFTLEAIKYFNLIQTVIWDKKTIGLGWRYRPSYETIIILSKSKDNYNFYDNSNCVSNIVRKTTVIPKKGNHPTPKPVALMEHFIRLHSQVNDIVLDPFMGIGSTCVACKNTNRRYIGIELDDKYFDIACDRLKGAKDAHD